MSDTPAIMDDDEWAAFAARLSAKDDEPALPLDGGSTTVPSSVTSTPILHDLVGKLEDTERALEYAKERRAALMEAIAREVRFPPDAMNDETVFEFVSGSGINRRVTVSRGEVRSWNKAMLLAMADAGEDPAGVIDLSATIKRTTFDALHATAQDTYKPALTRKPGNLSIKIERI
jgi:hypothetical protein